MAIHSFTDYSIPDSLYLKTTENKYSGLVEKLWII